MAENVKVLNHLGFKDVTKEVMEGLTSKNTKVAQFVVDRSERADYYIVLASENQCTIVSYWLITKKEEKQISSFLGLDYAQDRQIAEKAGLRREFLGFAEFEVAEEAPAEEITVESAYEAAPYEAKLSIDGELEAEDKDLNEVDMAFLVKNVKWTIEKLGMDINDCEDAGGDEEELSTMKRDVKSCEKWLAKYDVAPAEENEVESAYEAAPMERERKQCQNWLNKYEFVPVKEQNKVDLFKRYHELLVNALRYEGITDEEREEMMLLHMEIKDDIPRLLNAAFNAKWGAVQ